MRRHGVRAVQLRWRCAAPALLSWRGHVQQMLARTHGPRSKFAEWHVPHDALLELWITYFGELEYSN
jgi:hypothetical protein